MRSRENWPPPPPNAISPNQQCTKFELDTSCAWNYFHFCTISVSPIQASCPPFHFHFLWFNFIFIFWNSYIESDSYYIFLCLNFGFGAVAPKKRQMRFISRIKTVFFIGQHSVASVQPLVVGLRKWQSPTNHSPVQLVNIHLKVKKK